MPEQQQKTMADQDDAVDPTATLYHPTTGDQYQAGSLAEYIRLTTAHGYSTEKPADSKPSKPRSRRRPTANQGTPASPDTPADQQ